MAQQANLLTLTIDGKQYSASGEWTMQFGGKSRTVERNLDGTLSEQYVPEPDVASGPIRFASGSDLEELIQSEGFTATMWLRDGTAYQLTGATVQNHPELDTEGGTVELELAGTGRFI
jgi:hypothetical protein